MMVFFLLLLLMDMVFATQSSAFNTTHSGTLIPYASKQVIFENHIFVAASSQATVFVNGAQKLVVKNTAFFGFAKLRLNTGDVVSIIARGSRGAFYGSIAELYINGRYIVTGRDGWTARKSFRAASNWMLPSYQLSEACQWRRPVLRPSDATLSLGMATYFDSPTAARYVWASDAAGRNTIFMRYVVGGQRCPIQSTIYFAADNTAQLFVNGFLKASSSDWTVFQTVALKLQKGDVVALKVTDFGGWFGAIASIQTGGFTSTGREDWRAVKAFPIFGDKNAWTYPYYNACSRPKAMLLPRAGEFISGKAPDFPYSTTGARYVWASNAGRKDQIFLRTVVGVQC